MQTDTPEPITDQRSQSLRPSTRMSGRALLIMSFAAMTCMATTDDAVERQGVDVPIAAERYDVDPDTGYRMEHYRAAVPQSVPGARTLDTSALLELLESSRAVLIDVLPPDGPGADPLDGSWVVAEPHDTLPGALWMPEVGRGFLDAEHQDYFRRNLRRLRGPDSVLPHDALLVFFCQANCWQSWNAARRAAEWGFGPIAWYPDGTDGWRKIDGMLVPARPLNLFTDEAQDPAIDTR